MFGKTTGTVRESGLTDANDSEKFLNMLHNLKEKWSALHRNGETFHCWFMANKSEEFQMSVIKSVRERAGLGCPPERFTTNRSEQTNRSIQEFVKKEWEGKLKRICASLAKLVNAQKQKIELAAVGKGEYKLKEKYKFLQISQGNCRRTSVRKLWKSCIL